MLLFSKKKKKRGRNTKRSGRSSRVHFEEHSHNVKKQHPLYSLSMYLNPTKFQTLPREKSSQFQKKKNSHGTKSIGPGHIEETPHTPVDKDRVIQPSSKAGGATNARSKQRIRHRKTLSASSVPLLPRRTTSPRNPTTYSRTKNDNNSITNTNTKHTNSNTSTASVTINSNTAKPNATHINALGSLNLSDKKKNHTDNTSYNGQPNPSNKKKKKRQNKSGKRYTTPNLVHNIINHSDDHEVHGSYVEEPTESATKFITAPVPPRLTTTRNPYSTYLKPSPSPSHGRSLSPTSPTLISPRNSLSDITTHPQNKKRSHSFSDEPYFIINSSSPIPKSFLPTT